MKTNFDEYAKWIGVVESRQDPLMLGRCQVRVFAWHTEDLSKIPSGDLFWTHPELPLNNPAPIPPKEGDMVSGYFFDGPSGQFPIMTGFIPGIPEMVPPITKGFSDQRSSSVLSTAPRPPQSKVYNTDGSGVTIIEASAATRNPQILGEPTTSRLARNQNISETIVQEKRDNLVQNIPSADGSTWSEPATPYAAVYPYNKVYEEESGHVKEVDNTYGAERLHDWHRSGTFEEIHPDGTKVIKIVGDGYEIVMEGKYVYVMGSCYVTVQGDTNLNVEGNVNLQVKNNVTGKVTGNWDMNVEGTYNVTSKGNMAFNAPRIDLNP